MNDLLTWVKPRWMTGDMVHCMVAGSVVHGVIISVQQANSVPDAEVRGLAGIQPWSYWVFGSNKRSTGMRVFGPIGQHQVLPPWN